LKARTSGRPADILRSNADAVALDLVGDGAVAARHGIVGVEPDLAG